MTRARYALALAALLAACATAERVSRQALRLTPDGRRALRQWDRYYKLARRLKKFHDSGHLDERDLNGVLYDFGILKTPPPHLPKGRPPAKARRFPVASYKGGWRWPLEAGIVSSEFGPRWGKNHHGLDIAADSGVPVFAAADGEVIYSGDGLRGYGNVVILQHDQRTTTLYAHNTANKVAVGQKVPRGNLVALLGSTGKSTGPHVHFEIRGDSGPVDPRKLLPKSRF